jgi:hypothetical protein
MWLFEPVSAPKDGVEQPTGSLTPSAVSMIKDTICLSHFKGPNQQEEELRRSTSPIGNFALVAFAF